MTMIETKSTAPQLSPEEAARHAEIALDRLHQLHQSMVCDVLRFARAQQLDEKEAWRLAAEFATGKAR